MADQELRSRIDKVTSDGPCTYCEVPIRSGEIRITRYIKNLSVQLFPNEPEVGEFPYHVKCFFQMYKSWWYLLGIQNPVGIFDLEKKRNVTIARGRQCHLPYCLLHNLAQSTCIL